MSAAAAVDPGPIDLPGPTGESNRYRLLPRGPVLCLGPGPVVLDQAVQALAAGNAVLAVSGDATKTLAPLLDGEFPIVALDGQADPAALGELDVAAVAWTGSLDAAASYRRVLSARPGAIIPLVRGQISPTAYSHEQAICIDTTAAGGNAALLAQTA